MFGKSFASIESSSDSRDKLHNASDDSSSTAPLTCEAMPLAKIIADEQQQQQQSALASPLAVQSSCSKSSNSISGANFNSTTAAPCKQQQQQVAHTCLPLASDCNGNSTLTSNQNINISNNNTIINSISSSSESDFDTANTSNDSPHIQVLVSSSTSASNSTSATCKLLANSDNFSNNNKLINSHQYSNLRNNFHHAPQDLNLINNNSNNKQHEQQAANNKLSFSTRTTQLISEGLESLSSRKFNNGQNSATAISFSCQPSKLERVLTYSATLFICAVFIMAVALIMLILSSSKNNEDSSLSTSTSSSSLEQAYKQTVISIENANKMYCLSPSCIKVASTIIDAIDPSVDPCQNFYLYSCGNWIKQNPLPEGKTNWGAFNKLWQDNQAIMRAVLESSDLVVGSAEHKAKIYYDSCLDKNGTIESKGVKPAQDLIESAGGWNISGNFNVDEWDLQSALQIYHNQFNRGGLFSWAVGTDERNSTRNIIQLDQGSLGLPSRDYYFNKTDKNVIDAYLAYALKVAELMGCKDCQESMKDVLEFEKSIANIMLPQDQRRNDESMYHKFSLKELNEKAPFLNWTKYFDDAYEFHSKTSISFSSQFKRATNDDDDDDALKSNSNSRLTTANSKTKPSTISRKIITDQEFAVVYSPDYFADLSRLLENQMKTKRGKIIVANYLGWSVIQSLAQSLPEEVRDANKLLRKTLMGSDSDEPNWRWCVSDTNQVMGFALGAMFVRKVFKGESKARVEGMINSIREAFQENMDGLEWMDNGTRQLAREKADHIKQMIGFPDFIMNSEKLDSKYEGLELEEENYFDNNIKVNVLSLRENMERISKLSNRTDWEMTPPMVNAYYTPTKNQIVLPAGILQTPFYNLAFPDSLNYGAMGVVLGHELTHAFDDQGREYDKDGNLDKWWYNDTLRKFEERVKCLVDQYSEYKIDENHVNGKQTLGENIADNGGLKAAFRAYERWASKQPAPRLPGLNLTNSQLFFVGFAQVWCSNSTPEALKVQILNDVHAPAEFRVIGTLSNSEEFAREFKCPLESKMNPTKKCTVW